MHRKFLGLAQACQDCFSSLLAHLFRMGCPAKGIGALKVRNDMHLPGTSEEDPTAQSSARV
eukprot:726083-Amphidinium_carterae.1